MPLNRCLGAAVAKGSKYEWFFYRSKLQVLHRVSVFALRFWDDFENICAHADNLRIEYNFRQAVNNLLHIKKKEIL